ncbi:MAG: lipocalin family protein [Candidatus Obscuribacterales bacterium]|nr:lipocalin family protein [Steroidobacteraceae bacterium]
MSRRLLNLALLPCASALLAIVGCTTMPKPPLKVEKHVDIQRFMGDWYVIANIPTFMEKGAHNAIESYRLDNDGTVAVTFTFRADAFDGKQKQYKPRGFILDRESNAIWGMQFIWPIKADYRIVYVAPDYSQTIVGREARDYVWIMARTPIISAADYQRHLDLIAAQGYDITEIQRVPQQWPAK